MDYIAVIDYEHLDNGMFLSAFARSLAQQKDSRGLIIHGESEYTERLLQTGMMREEAVVRATRDLNHRLIALFADHGVSAIGLNAYQRSLIRMTPSGPEVDVPGIRRLPKQPHLLISNLIESGGRPRPLELKEYAALLGEQLKIEDVFIFSLDDTDEIITKNVPEVIDKDQLGEVLSASKIPSEFREIPIPVRLSTARSFASWPSLKGSVLLKNRDTVS